MMDLAQERVGVVENGDRIRTEPRRITDPVYINTEAWTTPVVAGGVPTAVVCRQIVCGDGEDSMVLDVPTDIDPDPRYDGWYTIFDTSKSIAYDLWRARREDDGSISYHFMRIWELKGEGFSDPQVVGARGSGLPLFAGLIRPGELNAGRIDHALAISVPGPATRLVRPARLVDRRQRPAPVAARGCADPPQGRRDARRAGRPGDGRADPDDRPAAAVRRRDRAGPAHLRRDRRRPRRRAHAVRPARRHRRHAARQRAPGPAPRRLRGRPARHPPPVPARRDGRRRRRPHLRAPPRPPREPRDAPSHAQRRRTTSTAGVAVLLTAGLLTSCSSDEPDSVDLVAEAQDVQERSELAEQQEIARRAAQLPDRRAGTVIIDGNTQSSLTRDLTDAYLRDGASTTVAVDANGDDRAFQRLCAGEIDVADSDREITRAEWDACRAVGLDVVQFQVGADAVVVAIKSESDVGGDCLDTQQVQDIYRAGSPVTSWAQVGLDDVPLSVGGPDQDNQAFGFFGRVVLDAPQPSLVNLRSDYRAFENDRGSRTFVVGSTRDKRLAAANADRLRVREELRSQVAGKRQVVDDAYDEVQKAEAEVAKGIRDRRPADQQASRPGPPRPGAGRLARGPRRDARACTRWVRARDRAAATTAAHRRNEEVRGHVAYFRFSHYELFEDQLRPFEITLPEGQRNCVFPSQRTIVSGEYPLAQRLLLTTTTRSLERESLRDLLEFALEHAVEAADEARLVPLPDATVAQQPAVVRGEQAPGFGGPGRRPGDGEGLRGRRAHRRAGRVMTASRSRRRGGVPLLLALALATAGLGAVAPAAPAAAASGGTARVVPLDPSRAGTVTRAPATMRADRPEEGRPPRPARHGLLEGHQEAPGLHQVGGDPRDRAIGDDLPPERDLHPAPGRGPLGGDASCGWRSTRPRTTAPWSRPRPRGSTGMPTRATTAPAAAARPPARASTSAGRIENFSSGYLDGVISQRPGGTSRSPGPPRSRHLGQGRTGGGPASGTRYRGARARSTPSSPPATHSGWA